MSVTELPVGRDDSGPGADGGAAGGCGVGGAWDDAVAIAGELNYWYALLVDLTAEVIATDGWGGQGGVRSPAHWLGLRTGLAPATAAKVVQVAQARDGLPVMAGLFAAGRLSLEQAAVIADRVPAAYEESVCDLAPMMTVTQLIRATAHYYFDPDDDNSAESETDQPGAGAPGLAPDSEETERATTEPDPHTAQRVDPAADGGEAPAEGGEAPAEGGEGPDEGSGPAPGAAFFPPSGPDTATGSDPDPEPGSEWLTTSATPGSPTGNGVSPDPASTAPLSLAKRRAAGLGLKRSGSWQGWSGRDPGRPGELTARWEDGRLVVRGSFDALEGALIENALREAKDALFTSGNRDATLADALVEMASRSLATVESPARADHYRVYVHIDTDTAWVNARTSLAKHLAQRLGCTAAAAALWERDGVPVSVGRAQRAVPARTRRLVEDRDRGCAYPGCGATRYVEIHHLRHWQDGGGTDYENLICLCPHHHDGHHAGAFTITASGNRFAPFTFTAAGGWPIHHAAPDPHPTSDPQLDLAQGMSADAGASPDSDAGPPGGPDAGPPGGRPRPPDRGRPYTPPLGERADYGWITYRKHPPARRDDPA